MTQRTTKTMKNIQRDNNFDHYIDVSGVSPVTLEMIYSKLEEQESFKSKVIGFMVFFFAISIGQIIGDVIGYLLNIK